MRWKKKLRRTSKRKREGPFDFDKKFRATILAGIVFTMIIFFVSMYLLPLEYMNFSLILTGLCLFILAWYVNRRSQSFINPPRGAIENAKLFSGYLTALGCILIGLGFFFFLMEFIFPELLVEDTYFVETRNTLFAELLSMVFLSFVVQFAIVWVIAVNGIQYSLLLKAGFNKKPAICPSCGMPAERGFLRSFQTRWLSPKSKKIIPPRLSSFLHAYAFPANICLRCNMLVGQYKPVPKGVSIISPVTGNGHYPKSCPHCDSRLKSGTMLAGYPFYWSEKYPSGFMAGKKHYVSAAIPIRSPRLSTKLCNRCGLFISAYKPERFRKANILGLVFWIVSFSIIFYVIYQMIPFMFGLR